MFFNHEVRLSYLRTTLREFRKYVHQANSLQTGFHIPQVIHVFTISYWGRSRTNNSIEVSGNHHWSELSVNLSGPHFRRSEADNSAWSLRFSLRRGLWWMKRHWCRFRLFSPANNNSTIAANSSSLLPWGVPSLDPLGYLHFLIYYYLVQASDSGFNNNSVILRW